MKTLIAPLLASLSVLLCGCSTTRPLLTPAMMQEGVRTAVTYGLDKYPNATVYVRAAEPIICSASEGTNLAPAQIVSELQEADVLRTPEALLIVNSALLLYEGVYNAYGADAVNNSAVLQPYLHAVCLGIGQGQPQALRHPRATEMNSPRSKGQWPLVR